MYPVRPLSIVVPLAAATSVNMPHCQLLVSTATEKEQKIKISQVRKA